jgi:Neuraminidase (sialidase)
LYRDANPRDMAIVRSSDGGETWSAPAAVGRFQWDITACPHVGGGLAIDSNSGGGGGGTRDADTHALVWTARDHDMHGVFALNSSNNGVTWTDPIRLGPHSASRPDLCAARDGRLVAAWDADSDSDADESAASATQRRGIYIATSADGGVTWSRPRRLSSANNFASHPRLIATPAGVRAFWTETPAGQPIIWSSAPVPVE